MASKLELGRWALVLYVLPGLISIFRLVTIVSHTFVQGADINSVLHRVVGDEFYWEILLPRHFTTGATPKR